MNCLDWAWVAGIFEGEACFSFNHSYPRISLQMTDEDIVKRIARYFDVNYSSRIPKNPKHKTVYVLCIIKTEKLIDCYLELYRYMGKRRSQRLDEFQQYWTNKSLLVPDLSISTVS